MAAVEKGMEFLFIKENVKSFSLFLQEIEAFWVLKLTYLANRFQTRITE